MSIIKPFIKWAGGKGQLINMIRQKYPQNISKYCEPFIGGGAVLFDILGKYHPNEVLINDINAELINTYVTVQNRVDDLVISLTDMQETFWNADILEQQTIYTQKRTRFNYLKSHGDEYTNIEKAALFIFLNKTCFNGLYRVNRSGQFNVSMGSYKNPLICDTGNLVSSNKILQNVNITCGDYRQCSNFIDSNTFVYIDPPYRPLTNTALFNSYSECIFDDEKQRELKLFVDDISSIGSNVLVSNSDPKNNDVNDLFFDHLYGDYNIERILARRMINCNANGRGAITEILISNY